MNTIAKVMLAICVGILLSGCNEKEDALYASPEVTTVGTFNSCEVTFINRGWEKSSFYMAKCPGNSTTTTRNYRQQSGKSSIPRRSTVITQEIEALQAEKIESDAREAALSKLSPTEKTALGIN